MKQSFIKVTRSFIILAILLLLPVLPGCGAVGPPIAPEDVGIEAKVREQQRQQSRQSKDAISADQGLSDQEEAVELPTFYPIGTR